MAMMSTPELNLEESLVKKLRDLKYEQRADIRDRATLEANFREKFEALNRVTLTDGEFQRLLDEVVTPDVYAAQLHPRQHQGLVQERLRGRQSAPHQRPSRTWGSSRRSAERTAGPTLRDSVIPLKGPVGGRCPNFQHQMSASR
jgi:hypothetical protein